MSNATSNLNKELTYRQFLANKVLEEFKKDTFQNIFINNLDALILNAQLIPFDQHIWFQKPDKYCLDKYELPDIFPIILLTNSIGSRFQFMPHYVAFKNYILTPTFENIEALLQRVIDLN